MEEDGSPKEVIFTSIGTPTPFLCSSDVTCVPFPFANRAVGTAVP